mgnify:FL=1
MTALGDFRDQWSQLDRWKQRVAIASFLAIESTLGLLGQAGVLNVVDFLLFDSLPTDLVWLLQTFILICVGFGLVKIAFEDMRPGWLRSTIIATSPILLFFYILLIIHILLLGLGTSASVLIDLASLGTNTLTWSSTYLSIAVGLTLTYSVQRYGNFAQSEFFMIGMYVGVALMWTNWLFPLNEIPSDGHLSWTLFLWMLFGAFVLTGIAGVIIDRLVYRGFRDRKASPDVMMIASLGVALVLRALTYLRFGGSTQRFVPDADWMRGSQAFEFPTILTRFNLGNRQLEPDQVYTSIDCAEMDSIPAVDIVTTTCEGAAQTTNYAYNNAFLPIVSFATVFILLAILTRTRLGRRMRAVADNPELAASSGINVERVHMTSAFLSAGISGVGGGIFGITLLFKPITAFSLLLPSFAVIVLGTIGSLPGAIAAALIIGFVRAVSGPVLIGIGNPIGRSGYSALAEVMPYAIIIAILLIIPKGIGDAYDRWKIERLRERARSPKAPNHRYSAALGVLLGPLGAHHFHQRRSGRAVSTLLVTSSAFFIGKATSFIRTNSYPSGSVISPQGVDPDIASSWVSLIESEQAFISIIGSIGDILWPWIPLLVWIFCVYESYLIYNNRYKDPIQVTKAKYHSIISRISSLSEGHSERTISRRLGERIESLRDNADSWLTARTTSFSGALGKRSDAILQKAGIGEGRRTESGSKAAFRLLLALLILFVVWLPVDPDSNFMFAKTLQVSNLVTFLSIYLIMSLSLNLSTGYTGLLNFGVIFFVSIGAIGVGVLTAPNDVAGYGWPIIPALVFSMLVAAISGWLLAYPTARLRGDYFAVITISLGEVVRILLSGEPLLKTGTTQGAIGVQRYPQPLEVWWFCGRGKKIDENGVELSPFECKNNEAIDSIARTIGETFSFGQPAPYYLLLAIIGLICVMIVWRTLSMLYSSPWGRILRSIREDEDVAQHHGHDVMTHKAAALAVSAAIAAFAGALFAWYLGSLQPSFMQPSRTTFLVWAAFVIGGAGNNRGMLIGAMIITLNEFVINRLVAAQSSPSQPLHELAVAIDEVFAWLVTEPMQAAILMIGIMTLAYLFRRKAMAESAGWFATVLLLMVWLLHQRSIDEVFRTDIQVNLAYVKVLIIGLIIVLSLKYNEKGLLPEVPYRPERPEGGDSQ